MATRKPTRSRRRDWPAGVPFQLCVPRCWDFFKCALGNGPERWDLLREAWADDAIRAEAYHLQAERCPGEPPFAEAVFGG